MELKLKFWDNERKIMLESPQSVLTAFRHYTQMAGLTGFSSCNNQPELGRYEPILRVGKDMNGEDIFTGDRVIIRLDIITDDPVIEVVSGVITYDEKECCFCVKVSENGDSELLPLFGITKAICVDKLKNDRL